MTQKKWGEIRKRLSHYSDRDLIGLVGDLYNLSKSNLDFLNACFLRDSFSIDTYKAKIKKYICPHEPWKNNQSIRLRDARNLISDYKKATGDKIGVLELKVYYVECGTKFTCDFGDMDEPFYSSLESAFGEALKISLEFPFLEIEDFIERLRKVMRDAYNIGWGYYDTLSDLMDEAYPPERK